MKRILNLFFVLCACVCGCKKQEAAAPVSAGPDSSTDSAATVAEPAPRAPSQAPAPTTLSAPKSPPPPAYVTARAENTLRQNVEGQPDAFLTRQLRVFMQKNGRLPDSFAEFVNSTLDSIPRPPDGKRWVIDIDSMQVKAVPSP